MQILKINEEYKRIHQIQATDVVSLDQVNEMLDEWLMLEPMPEVTDLHSFTQAVDKAYWALMHDRSTIVFSCEKYPLDVPAYKWNIEQAIINRDSNKTMLSAALEYVETLTANL